MTTAWDPGRYDRFAAERRQPFDDLLALCEPVPGASIVDLGCGTGRLTVDLHRALGAGDTLGIDSSPEMLAKAPSDVPGVTFVQGDLAEWSGPPADVVFANASLQWVGEHPGLLERLRHGLRPGGQLAFQVPNNFSHPAYVLARSMAGLGESPVVSPVRYAELLHSLGAVEQKVRLAVYGHVLDKTADVADWVSSTYLVPAAERLGPEAFGEFLESYRMRLVAELGDQRPYFFTFQRILCWATYP